jgi:uncharacterized protein Yka (UPF0111/DUF47 family)
MPKASILQQLGADEVLLPGRINDALQANDRAKYFLTLLQTARSHADAPASPVGSTAAERLASGVEWNELDAVVEASVRLDGGLYLVPHAADIVRALLEAVGQMLEPLQTDPSANGATLERRLAALTAELSPAEGDVISGQAIDCMASISPKAGDSLHRVIMDGHKALNRLQREVATELLDGAAAYGLAEQDRPLVRAFMRGLNRTAPLKFDHPGLDTTATRSGRQLIIQNDIGTTDAHVIVLRVDGLDATLTYTDVHPQRLRFFQALLGTVAVTWTLSSHRNGPGDADYQLATGTFAATDAADLAAFLEQIGSRIVFLIDWNRARKRLQPVLGKRKAVDLLKWAADQDYGHRAFLTLGGEQLLYQAVETASNVPVRYGQPIEELLGAQQTEDLARFAVQRSSEGLRTGKSERLIRDELRAAAGQYLRSAREDLLDICAAHASLIVEAAMTVDDVLFGAAGGGDDRAFAQRAALRGRRWEHDADALLNRVRSIVNRLPGSESVERLLATADDAMDDFEEALFWLSLGQSSDGWASLAGELIPLGNAAVIAAQEHLKAMEGARLAESSPGERLDGFLEAVDRVMAAEHEADDANRTAKTAIVTASRDYHQLQIATELVQSVEDGVDALLRSALLLREQILSRGARL